MNRFLVLAKRGALFCVPAYFAILSVMVLSEGYLVFPAPSLRHGDWDSEKVGAIETEVASGDGHPINVWLFAHSEPKGTIIYSHGNRETLGLIAKELAFLRDRLQVNVIAYDYRGYGKTGGTPSAKTIALDAVAVGEWTKNTQPWNEVPILAMGRSLGGFPANVAATECQLDGLILDRTFDSIVNVAAIRFPAFPIRYMMRNRLLSSQWIQKNNAPLLQIHGRDDNIVPFETGKALFEQSPSPKKFFMDFEKLHHNAPLPDSFWKRAEEFIDEVRSDEH